MPCERKADDMDNAHPGRNPVTDSFKTMDLDTLPPELAEVLREAQKIRTEPELYVAMLRDWAANGADSQYALSPDEVVARSRPRDLDGRPFTLSSLRGQKVVMVAWASW